MRTWWSIQFDDSNRSGTREKRPASGDCGCLNWYVVRRRDFSRFPRSQNKTKVKSKKSEISRWKVRVDHKRVSRKCSAATLDWTDEGYPAATTQRLTTVPRWLIFHRQASRRYFPRFRTKISCAAGQDGWFTSNSPKIESLLWFAAAECFIFVCRRRRWVVVRAPWVGHFPEGNGWLGCGDWCSHRTWVLAQVPFSYNHFVFFLYPANFTLFLILIWNWI